MISGGGNPILQRLTLNRHGHTINDCAGCQYQFVEDNTELRNGTELRNEGNSKIKHNGRTFFFQFLFINPSHESTSILFLCCTDRQQHVERVNIVTCR